MAIYDDRRPFLCQRRRYSQTNAGGRSSHRHPYCPVELNWERFTCPTYLRRHLLLLSALRILSPLITANRQTPLRYGRAFIRSAGPRTRDHVVGDVHLAHEVNARVRLTAKVTGTARSVGHRFVRLFSLDCFSSRDRTCVQRVRDTRRNFRNETVWA